MKCNRCGAELGNNASFCAQCGEVITVTGTNSGYSEAYPNNDRAKNTLIVVLIILLAITLLCVVSFATYMFMSGKSAEDTPTPTPVLETAQPTETIYAIVTAPPATPVPTAAPAQPPSLSQVEYNWYIDDEYGFECRYPSYFVTYDDGLQTRYTVKSPDNSAYQKMDAYKTDTSMSDIMNSFISSKGGYIDYKTIKGEYFAVRVVNGATCHYKYARKRNSVVYTFELTFPYSQFTYYDSIVNSVYKSFVIY